MMIDKGWSRSLGHHSFLRMPHPSPERLILPSVLWAPAGDTCPAVWTLNSVITGARTPSNRDVSLHLALHIPGHVSGEWGDTSLLSLSIIGIMMIVTIILLNLEIERENTGMCVHQPRTVRVVWSLPSGGLPSGH